MSHPSRRGGFGCGGGGGGGLGGGGCNPLSLYKHNNNTSNTLLAALLMYFQAKTGIFASCVIYCGSHLHIKALIIPSEHVCVSVCVCVCVCVRAWEGVTAWTCSQEKGNDQHFGVWIVARGELSHLPPRLPLWTGWF